MKLDLEQIKNITRGTERIGEESDGIHFYRFKEEEKELYKDVFDRYFNCMATSGVQMRFKTDADKLFIKGKASVKVCDKRFSSFDLWIDGEKSGTIGALKYDENETDGIANATFEECVELGNGEKAVRIIFPWFSSIALESIELLNATFVENITLPKTILMYGDSITHGAHADTPSDAYTVKLADYLNAELYCKGIGGDTFTPALAKIKCNVKPDYVTVAYGTNDWSRKTREEFEKDCKNFYEIVSKTYPDAKIFAISPIWRADLENDKPCGDFASLGDYIKSVVEKLDNVHYINGFELVPHKPEMFGDLYLHPNKDGFAHYFNNLKKEIEQVLK